jgi:hypothetical protein
MKGALDKSIKDQPMATLAVAAALALARDYMPDAIALDIVLPVP